MTLAALESCFARDDRVVVELSYGRTNMWEPIGGQVAPFRIHLLYQPHLLFTPPAF
jgi:hypothetical protein